MDPASAIGVAAATVQFFAIGIKAIRLGKQICASKAGTTEANEALETSLKAISEIRKDLRHAIIRDVNSNIAKAQKQCLEIAEKLLKVLESIKRSSQSAKSKFLKDVSATWQAMRARSKIDKLEQELRAAQNLFKEALTVETRNAVAQVLESQSKDTGMLQTLWDETQKLRPELQQARKENNAAHQETLSGVARIEKMTMTEHAATQSSHQATLGAIDDLDTNVQAQFSDMRVTDFHRDILESLRYPDMMTRQQEISPPAPGTYEWVFTGESPHQDDPDIGKDFLSADLERRKKLLHWFSADESLFWINGKPGSGKSSLMSFVANDGRTLQALEPWAGQRPVHIIKFFFWRPGSPLQRSVPGLLRSLLYQILLIDTSVIDRLLAENSISRHPTWEQVELLRILEIVLRLRSNQHICFFIDGLDEHDGDYMTLLDLILRTHARSNVKICLSSRPEPAFRLRLSTCSSVSMQDLNQADIKSLVQQKLEPLGSTSTSFIEEVTERAEGIILWAALVCNSLLRGYTTYDDEAMLRKRLDETPSGLRNLFLHMLSKIDKTHRNHLRVYCHLLKWASRTDYTTHYTSLSLIAAVLQSEHIGSVERVVESCARSEQQILGYSQGLIEIGRRQSTFNFERGLWCLAQAGELDVIGSRPDVFTQKLFEYCCLHIQWVHRSAHDCIFGESGESIAPWIIMADDQELRRKIVKCLLWLAEHSPMVGVSRTKTLGDFLETRLEELVQDILPLTTVDSGYQIVGELHDSILATFPGHNRQNRRERLQHIGINDFWVPVELFPLLSLWHGILQNGSPSFIDQLVNKPFAAAICGGLLVNNRCHSDEALMCRLLDCISRDFRSCDISSTFSGKLLHNRHFRFRQRGRIRSPGLKNRIVLSWLGCGDDDEANIVQALALITGSSGSSPINRSWLRILDILEARDVWRGPSPVDTRQHLSPLQFMLPNRAFLQWWTSSSLKAPPSLAKLASPFRLTFMHRSELIRISRTLQQQPKFKPKVVATFDLSVAATAALLSQRATWAKPDTHNPLFIVRFSFEMSWVGTPAEFSACLQVILEEIWADRGHQLDAWQQLYALACVKLCFKRMWKIRDDAEVARWMRMK